MKALYKYVMAILLFTIVFVTNSYGQFKLVGDAGSGGFNNAGSNRYSATIVFRPDLTGNYYDGTDVLSGYKLFTSSEQMYTIINVSSTTYNTASVTIQADTILNTNSSTFYGVPSGQVLIYDSSESEGALQVPFGSVGASARMQAAVDSWNIKVISNLLSKTVNVEPSFLTDIIRFNINTDSVGTEEGHVIWNAEDHTLDIHSQNGAVLQVNQEMVIPVKNKSGVIIENGMPVRFAGTEGASGRLLVQAAVADGSYPVYYNLGTTTNTIPNDSTGLVTVFGKVRGIDLDGISYLNCNDEEWEDGTLLYLDPVTEGCYTSIMPSAPNDKVLYAAIVAAKNNGTMMVRPSLFSDIRDLNGINIVNEQDGQVIAYNANSNVWENTTIDLDTILTQANDYADSLQKVYTISVISDTINIIHPKTGDQAITSDICDFRLLYTGTKWDVIQGFINTDIIVNNSNYISTETGVYEEQSFSINITGIDSVVLESFKLNNSELLTERYRYLSGETCEYNSLDSLINNTIANTIFYSDESSCNGVNIIDMDFTIVGFDSIEYIVNTDGILDTTKIFTNFIDVDTFKVDLSSSSVDNVINITSNRNQWYTELVDSSIVIAKPSNSSSDDIKITLEYCNNENKSIDFIVNSVDNIIVNTISTSTIPGTAQRVPVFETENTFSSTDIKIAEDRSIRMLNDLYLSDASAAPQASNRLIFDEGNTYIAADRMTNDIDLVTGGIRHTFTSGSLAVADVLIRKNGTESAPSFVFTVSYPTTGLYRRIGFNQVSISTAGTTAATFTQQNKVGINISENVPFGLYVNHTDAVRLATGTIAQQPIAELGLIRANTDSDKFEIANSTEWNNIATENYVTQAFSQTKSHVQLFYNTAYELTQGSYNKLTGGNASLLQDFTVTDSTITYVGTGGVFEIDSKVNVLVTAGGSGEFFLQSEVYINNVGQNETEVIQSATEHGGAGSVAINNFSSMIVELSTGDVIDLRVSPGVEAGATFTNVASVLKIIQL